MFGQILIYGLVTATQVLFFALALYIIRLVSRSVNLALGGIATAVAYGFYFAFTQMQWSLVLALLFAAVIGLLLGGINYYITEPLTRRNQSMLILIASISFTVVLESLVSIIFGTDGKSLTSGIVPVVQFGAYQLPISGLIIVAGGLFIAIIVGLLYVKTPFGRKLRAIAENQFTAVSMGINQPRYRLIAYMIAALIVGAVGILEGFNTALVPKLGFNLLAMGFISLLVGGVDDILGAVVAAYALLLTPELVIGLVPSVSANWRFAFVFLIASILLIIRPHGLFSREHRAS